MDEIEIIQQLDADQQTWSDEFATGLLVMNRALLDDLYSLIDRLFLRGRSTTAGEVASNMRAVIMYRAELGGMLIRAGFSDALNGLLTHMGQSVERLNAYYGAIVSDFKPGAYASLVEGLAAQTRTLLVSRLDAVYGQAIGDVLTWSVLTKSTAAEMRTALRDVLSESGLPGKHIATTADDALYTFSRGYAQSVAEGLNLKHYYYMGTQIANTRSFCAARLGKAYTQPEVEAWANLTWSGKVPGTTKQTIYWYCGGFRCRHRLLPISKSVYKSLTVNN